MNPQNSINSSENLLQTDRVFEFYAKLEESLECSRQRVILHIQGERAFCLEHLPAFKQWGQPLIISNQTDFAQNIPFSKVETLLGTECDYLIYDLFSGFNIDVFCLCCGLVKAGGMLIMISPENMRDIDDPYGVWQTHRTFDSRFTGYVLEQLKTMGSVRQGSAEINMPDFSQLAVLATFKNHKTDEQTVMLEDMHAWFNQSAQPVFLLTAHRGRGKSTVLGFFAQEIQHETNIIVTAASRNQVTILLKQLNENACVQFLAPDELIRRNEPIDCLIIDEAAMLPLSMLDQLMCLGKKTVLATTTGGYEGTGQGFLLKFIAAMDKKLYMHRQLLAPVRWGLNDKLEEWMNRVLFFSSAEPIGVASNLTKEALAKDEVKILGISKQKLSSDIGLLKSVYGLLVSAHYRTRPSDLRQLMDDDNQRVILAIHDQQVIGVLLLNQEGGFDQELSQDISLGKRRPKGHLLSQMIAAQAGVKNFATYRGLRIQRVAVMEQYRLQGIGRQLIDEARELINANEYDYLGSSFALDHTLSHFWKEIDFKLVHVASGKGKSSGRQTVAVLFAGRPEIIEIIKVLQQKMKDYLTVWLLSYCNSMCWQDVQALIQMMNVRYTLSQQDEDEITAFATGYRGFELTQASLQKFILNQLHKDQPINLAEVDITLLIEKILLNRSSHQLSHANRYSGRKELLQQLRLIIKSLNE
mgnify:CR=1 FL=1